MDSACDPGSRMAIGPRDGKINTEMGTDTTTSITVRGDGRSGYPCIIEDAASCEFDETNHRFFIAHPNRRTDNDFTLQAAMQLVSVALTSMGQNEQSGTKHNTLITVL